MKNTDNQCFKWCIARALIPAKREIEKSPDRITKHLRKQAESLNFKGIEFPMNLQAIDKFERLNPEISVNVFGFDNITKVYPLRISKFKGQKEIDLLLLENKHYCLVKNLSRLMSMQTSKRHGEIVICRRCLNHFPNEKALEKHEENCQNHEAIKIVLPENGSVLQFKNHKHSMRVPIVVYADFESFPKPIDSCQPDPNRSFTKACQKDEPSGFCFYVKCLDKYSEPILFTKTREEENVAGIFVDMLEKETDRVWSSEVKEMIFSEDDRAKFEKAREFWICQKPFEVSDDKVRDHCHFSGQFRGAAHNKCNPLFRKPKHVPVIFHNLSGYDSHLFIKNLGKTQGQIDCIPNNEEKYISFSKRVNDENKKFKYKIRFIDSLKFMPSSLDKPVNNLEPDQFKNLKEQFNDTELLVRKGVFPYGRFDSLERLSEKNLPPKESFYSKLNDCDITDKDYEHALKVWKRFKMTTFGEYHDLYLKTDLLLLADVFENFRNVCMKNYELDPAWYYTTPGLSQDACLKMTGVQLELLSDPDMLLMIEQGIRGGVSMISKRYAKTNNKYMGEKFNPNEKSIFILYLDAHNLYGWAMSLPLPVGGFKWMNKKDLKNWREFSDQKGRGCILEVDLEYPKKLYDLHNEYPLAPERIVVNKVEKLIPNLNEKKKYVLHHKNLKQYLDLGLKITKIHRGISFDKKAWLKQYIDLNTNFPTAASSEFEKDFFKLMNNSMFGKTMENIRNRVNIRLVNNQKSLKKCVTKPNFDHYTVFDENLVAVHMKKTELVFNKPMYLGMSILDLSKTLMYDFHYIYIKKEFSSKANLLFTDTVSLCYEIETEDFYKDISDDVQEKFDTSNFSPNHPSTIPTGINKKVPGIFKDEAGGEIIEEFVGLRAKLYAIKKFDGEEEKKCKGVKRIVITNKISFSDYKDVLFSGKEVLRTMNVIRSRQHTLSTEQVNKIALSANDDKRIIRPDKIQALAHGFQG